jgi:methylated-DNA-[protein]-cysteine S-methyltransferase
MTQSSIDTPSYFKSPIGWIKIIESTLGLTSLKFSDTTSLDLKLVNTRISRPLNEALSLYFKNGNWLNNLSMNPQGTPFQKEIWEILKQIPKGKTKTYKQIALLYGDLNSIRAVANAIGKNPIMLFTPCHRVVGRNGSMTGYAGGIEKKKWLLEHEGVSIQKTLDL